MTRMLWTLRVPFCQKSWIRMLPFCSMAYAFFFDGVCMVLVGWHFGLCKIEPAKMSGSLHTCIVLKNFLDMSVTPSWNSLWRDMTRSPFLQSRARKMEKLELQPSQNLGRSGGSRPYRRKRTSHHYCAHSSVLFTFDSRTIIHPPIFITLHKRHVTWKRAPNRVSASATSERLSFRFRTSYLPSLINAVWYADLNSSWSLSGATRCPVMTQDSVQFSGTRRSSGRRTTPHL